MSSCGCHLIGATDCTIDRRGCSTFLKIWCEQNFFLFHALLLRFTCACFRHTKVFTRETSYFFLLSPQISLQQIKENLRCGCSTICSMVILDETRECTANLDVTHKAKILTSCKDNAKRTKNKCSHPSKKATVHFLQ